MRGRWRPAAVDPDPGVWQAWGDGLARTLWSQARLDGTGLTGTDLTSAPLTKAHPRQAVLRDAILFEADCTAADFRGADLRGADFTGAVLVDADVRGAIWDETTRSPDGFEPPTPG